MTNQMAYFILYKSTWLKLLVCKFKGPCDQLGQVHAHFHLDHADVADGVQVVAVVAQRDILEFFPHNIDCS